jgi:hypothetical protein
VSRGHPTGDLSIDMSSKWCVCGCVAIEIVFRICIRVTTLACNDEQSTRRLPLPFYQRTSTMYSADPPRRSRRHTIHPAACKEVSIVIPPRPPPSLPLCRVNARRHSPSTIARIENILLGVPIRDPLGLNITHKHPVVMSHYGMHNQSMRY